MAMALGLARRGCGLTSPNPVVGAVIVKKGAIIGKGWHKRAGLAHAEIEALKGLGRSALRGAVLYVTLEPCCHVGRTGACTEAILASGIKKVVVGALDPNPMVSGRGVEILRSRGVEVIAGVLGDKARAINEWFEKFITTGLPFVRLKLAASLDGRIASPTGESKWITGEASRRYVHRLRALADAVMIGSNTAMTDDPALTVRHVKGANPCRVAVDSAFTTPLSAKLFHNASDGVIILTTRRAGKKKVLEARSMGAKVFYIRSKGPGRVDIKKGMEKLGQCGVANILVEGGGVLTASLIKAGLVDRVSYFMAPMFLGADSVPSIGRLFLKKPSGAPRLKDIKVRRLGDDILVEGGLAGQWRQVRSLTRD